LENGGIVPNDYEITPTVMVQASSYAMNFAAIINISSSRSFR